ncbi:50S ribosomal protein L1 [Bienertia sinuspersici]
MVLVAVARVLRLQCLLIGLAIKNFLKFNEIVLQKFPCQISDPIPLREDAGVGFMKGADSLAMPKVGKLRKDLPNVPHNAHIDFPRYNVDEAAAVCHYYLSGIEYSTYRSESVRRLWVNVVLEIE